MKNANNNHHFLNTLETILGTIRVITVHGYAPWKSDISATSLRSVYRGKIFGTYGAASKSALATWRRVCLSISLSSPCAFFLLYLSQFTRQKLVACLAKCSPSPSSFLVFVLLQVLGRVCSAVRAIYSLSRCCYTHFFVKRKITHRFRLVCRIRVDSDVEISTFPRLIDSLQGQGRV